ncbi:MAG: 4Fe-4S dicluster domain-containing protein [Spirochaetota bacterium]
MKKEITVKVERCMGCHTCELACAEAHSSTKDVLTLVQKGEKPGYRIFVEAYKTVPVPVPCRQCEEAACILACPTGAVHRNSPTAPVLVDDEKCIGCMMCVQACPFGMMSVKSNGKGVLKCDLCIERLAKGQLPACVAACPTRALGFSSDDEANQPKRKKVAMQMVTAMESQGEGGQS